MRATVVVVRRVTLTHRGKPTGVGGSNVPVSATPRTTEIRSVRHREATSWISDRSTIESSFVATKKVSSNSGGIIIPDTAKEKPQRGTVIAAGSGTVRDGGTRVPLDVKAGDVILFGKYTSQEIKLDGEEFLIMREDEVLAVVETG